MVDTNANTTALTAPLPSTAADLAPVASAPAVSDAAQAAPTITVQAHKSIVANLEASVDRWVSWYHADLAKVQTLFAGVKRHWVALTVYTVVLVGLTHLIMQAL